MMFKTSAQKFNNFYKPNPNKLRPDMNTSVSSQYRTAAEVAKRSTKKRNSTLMSPDTKQNLNTTKYSTNEKKRKTSKQSRRKNTQTSLLRNKDYRCIPTDENISGFILTERNHNTQLSPRLSGHKSMVREPQTDIKTVEIDVANEISPPWFNLQVMEGYFKASKSLMKEAMKNYFVFLEFFK